MVRGENIQLPVLRLYFDAGLKVVLTDQGIVYIGNGCKHVHSGLQPYFSPNITVLRSKESSLTFQIK
jgi:hypothetical protein